MLHAPVRIAIIVVAWFRIRQPARQHHMRRNDSDVLPAVDLIRQRTRIDAPLGRVREEAISRACIEGVEFAGVAALNDHIAGRPQIAGAAAAAQRRMPLLPHQSPCRRVIGRHRLDVRNTNLLAAKRSFGDGPV